MTWKKSLREDSLKRLDELRGFFEQLAPALGAASEQEKTAHRLGERFLRLVEMRGIEPLSENPFIQLSPGASVRLEFPSRSAGRQAQRLGSPLMRGSFKSETAAHVHC